MISSGMTDNLSEKTPLFYINADVSEGWPYRSDSALCKFGVTSKPPSVRCNENERDLRRKWGIDATLEVVCVATGDIVFAERDIADRTLPWLPDFCQRSAEWRRCPPRELARIAILVAEDRQR